MEFAEGGRNKGQSNLAIQLISSKYKMVAKKAKVINASNFTIVVGVHQNQNVKSNPMK
jgi:hypothetical protein